MQQPVWFLQGLSELCNICQVQYHLLCGSWSVFIMQQFFEAPVFDSYIETQCNLLSAAILIVMVIR